jgi:hypothetical protein
MNVDVDEQTGTVYYITIRDDDGKVVDRFKTMDKQRVERTKRRYNRL